MKESKNIYELLNQVEVNIEDYEKEELSDMEKQKLKDNFKKNIRKKINLKKFGIIAAALILTISVVGQTNIGKNVYAAAESKISEMYYSIGKALGIKTNIEPYANVVNQTVQDKGIEVKLTDVIIDKDELIFSTIVNTDKRVDGFRFDSEIFINGKRLTNYGTTGRRRVIDDSNTLFLQTDCVGIKGIDTKENVDIKIELSDFNYYIGDAEENIKGRWKFEFAANGEELTENTYVLPIEHSFDIDEQSYSLEEFRLNPVNQKIFGKVKGKSTDAYQIDLRGVDNLGNEVVFFLESKSGEDIVFKYENIYGDLSNEITSVTLTPYAAKLPEKSGRMSGDWNQVGKEFTISIQK